MNDKTRTKYQLILLIYLFSVFVVVAGDLEVDNLTVNESVYLVPSSSWVISDEAVSQWTLNDNTNTSIVVESISTNNGVMTDPGGSTNTSSHHVTGITGGALDFDGTNEYVDISSHASEYSGYSTGTISLWFKSSSSLNSMILFGAGDTITDRFEVFTGNNFTGTYADESLYFTLKTSDSFRIRFCVRHGEGYYMDGEWHHVVITVNTNSNSVYIDGTLETPTYETGNASTGNYFLNLSGLDTMGIARRFFPGSALYYQGLVDNVIIFDRAITSAEVATLYNSGSGLESSSETAAAQMGIGTDSPSETLHVVGTVRADQGFVYSPALGDISMGSYTNGQ